MKKFAHCLIFFSIFYSPYSQADYPYFNFTNKKIEINDQHFIRYIRPQAKSIIQEYYSLIKKFKVYDIDLMKLYSEFKILKLNWEQFLPNCQKNQNCQKIINQSILSLNKISTQCYAYIENGLKLEPKENALKLKYNLPKSNDIKEELLAIGNQVERLVSDLYLEKIRESSKNTLVHFDHKIENELHRLLLKSEKIIFYSLPEDLRDPHEKVWVSYIKPLEEKVLLESNKASLVEALGDFNLAWNGYHMVMLKGNIKLDSKTQNLIVLMHNRWNSILKLIL